MTHCPRRCWVLLLTASAVCAGAADVRDAERAFVSVHDKVAPAVVSLVVVGSPSQDDAKLPLEEKLRRFFGENPNYGYRFRGVGSGLIIDPGGFVLTNSHVVEKIEQVTVILHDGRRLAARVMGRAPHRDLAVLKVEAEGALSTARFADVTGLRVGQYAIALGNPFALARDPEPTMTVGHISALRRTIPAPAGDYEFTDVIQTDAAINPGNSGGPLVNIEGEVIGINAALFTTSGGSIGIGFAIPMDAATLKLVDDLKRGATPQIGWIGVLRCQALTTALARYYKVEPGAGVLALELAPDGPAARAGLKVEDILVAADGQRTPTPTELGRVVEAAGVGREIEIQARRQGQVLKVKVKVEQRPFDGAPGPAGPRSWRGLEVEDIAKARKLAMGLAADAEGVAVTTVAEASAAARAGLKPGDVILRVNHTDVPSARVFLETVRAIAPTEDALLKTLDRMAVVEGVRR